MKFVQLTMLLALCMPFVLVAWIAFINRRQAWATAPYRAPEDAGFGPAIGGFVDLKSALQSAAAALSAQARARSVRVELAVRAGTSVRVDPGILAMALQDTMTTAIQATPGGKVLVTAAILGDQLHIRIADDGVAAGPRIREVALLGVAALIAQQGGSIGVEVRHGRGTTIALALRLSLPEKASGGDSLRKQRPVLATQDA
jgi:signal transduction histidine kinase